MLRSRLYGLLVAGAVVGAWGICAANAAEPIGLVKTLSGAATVDRAGTVAALTAGADLMSDDIISTGAEGAIGVTFRDDTTLSMGPNGRMVLDRFAFDPAGEDLGLELNFIKGTFSVVSGQIAKLSPEAVRVTTPTMALGIRGTSFLVEVEGDE